MIRHRATCIYSKALFTFHKLVSFCCLGSNVGIELNLLLVDFLPLVLELIPMPPLMLLDLSIHSFTNLWQAALVGFPFIWGSGWGEAFLFPGVTKAPATPPTGLDFRPHAYLSGLPRHVLRKISQSWFLVFIRINRSVSFSSSSSWSKNNSLNPYVPSSPTQKS